MNPSQSAFTNLYCQLPSHFFSEITPEPLHEPKLVHHNRKLHDDLTLSLSAAKLLEMVSGNEFPKGCRSVAQKYTGHQFGYYNPDLGDGRGVLLGQWRDSNQQPWDLHLKGCGRTPYSRRGDGRAVLRSAIREHLGGEALHALGINSTRSLAICHNLEAVLRETLEPRASYLRTAKTHVRFGHFEWLAQIEDKDGMQVLADYVIETVYPHLKAIDAADRYSELLNTITHNTAVMIAGWQSVGFCHGVLNSDNMSVAGETFDFGPYAFMDDFEIHFICNHSDTEGRYAYSQQPNIGLWNCQLLAQAFGLLVSEQQQELALNTYVETYNQEYLQRMRAKIGLQEPLPEDRELVSDLLILMDQSRLDFQHFFLQLADFENEQACLNAGWPMDSKKWRAWLNRYFIRRQLELLPNECPKRIRQHTPLFVLRNYINQEVIDAAEHGNFDLIDRVFQALSTPFEKVSGIPDRYYAPPQSENQKGLILSCSS